MKLIIGLGNPGKKYERTRHNAGFIFVDQLAARCGVGWRENKRLFSFVARCRMPLAENSTACQQEEIILAKPLTFMNSSGKAAAKLLKHYHLTSRDLTVVHDDLDLPWGEFRRHFGRGAAGHHGVESIISALGTKDFWRIRIGICPEEGKPGEPEEFVLGRFGRDELKALEDLAEKQSWR